MITSRQKRFFALLVFLILGLGSLSYFSMQSQLQTISPKRGEIVEAIYGLGRVKPRREYEIKVAIISTAEKVFVREGDSVEAGAPLLKLSDSAVFRAPFSGAVSLVAIDEGEPTLPNSPLLRVEDLSDKFIEVSLEQQGALRVQKGHPAEVIFESIRGEKLSGKVSALFSRNDEFLAHINVEGLKANILPGMTADIAIVVARHKNALLIPVSSVNNGFVTILNGRKQLKKSVKIGSIDGQMAEVVGGELSEDDQIIVRKAK